MCFSPFVSGPGNLLFGNGGKIFHPGPCSALKGNCCSPFCGSWQRRRLQAPSGELLGGAGEGVAAPLFWGPSPRGTLGRGGYSQRTLGGAHVHLLLVMCLQSEREVGRVRLFETPWTVAYQDSPSMGSSRQEYWSGVPFPSPRDLPNPGIELGSPSL